MQPFTNFWLWFHDKDIISRSINLYLVYRLSFAQSVPMPFLLMQVVTQLVTRPVRGIIIKQNDIFCMHIVSCAHMWSTSWFTSLNLLPRPSYFLLEYSFSV